MSRTKLNNLQENFSGAVQTYTNTGTAGGTGYYINLGGLKMCWGTTGILALSSATNFHAVINFPASFFTTIQSCVVTPTGAAASGDQFWGISADVGPSTSSIDIWFYETAKTTTTGNCTASWFVMGT